MDYPFVIKEVWPEFRCGLCGCKFEAGNTARWVKTNQLDRYRGDPFVCETCDGPDVIEKWKSSWTEHCEPKFHYRWARNEVADRAHLLDSCGFSLCGRKISLITREVSGAKKCKICLRKGVKVGFLVDKSENQ